MDINKQIQEAIEKNLPKQMGDVLQKRFAELEAIESKYKDLNDLYTNQSTELSDLKKERDQLTKDLAVRMEMLKNIKEREDAVTKKENELELNVTKIKLEEADKRATELHGLVQTVFKSPVYRKSYNIMGSSKHTGNDQYGNAIYSQEGDKNGDVTETVE